MQNVAAFLVAFAVSQEGTLAQKRGADLGERPNLNRQAARYETESEAIIQHAQLAAREYNANRDPAAARQHLVEAENAFSRAINLLPDEPQVNFVADATYGTNNNGLTLMQI